MNLISQNIESFSNILNNECKPLFGKRLNINSKAMDGQQDWFDNDCKTKHVDFKKAFTYVVRDIRWFKLFRYGVRGNIMNVVRSMYENTKSRIKTSDTYLSEEFYCGLGVRRCS